MDELDCIQEEFITPPKSAARGRRARSEISRSCRTLETPNASSSAEFEWWQHREQRRTNLECEGGREYQNFRPWRSTKAAYSTGKSANSSEVQTYLEHAKSLKSRRMHLEMRGPQFLSPVVNERTIASPHQTCAAILQSNANHVAVVPSAKKKKGEASAQQTTRILIGQVGLVSSQQQCCVSFICGMAEADARLRKRATPECSSVEVRSPSCSFEAIPSEILAGAHDDGAFVIHTTTESFLASTPLSTRSRDFLAIMTNVAKDELCECTISNVVPQTTSHLHEACKRITSAEDGSRIWFAFALICWMVQSDWRLHRILDQAGANDFDFAIADALTRYGNLQIGNRARRAYSDFSTIVAKLAESNRLDLDALNSSIDRSWDDRVVDRVFEAAPDLELHEVCTVARAANNTLASRKNRRSSNSSEMRRAPSVKKICKGILKPQKRRSEASEESDADADVDLSVNRDDVSMEESEKPTEPTDACSEDSKEEATQSYTGAVDVRDFEIFFCHFMSTLNSNAAHSCSLKHLISESASAASDSAKSVVAWQLGSWQVTPTEEVYNLSVQAALHTRAQIAKLLDQKPESSPKMVSWSLSDMSNRVVKFVGVNHRTSPPLFMIGRTPPNCFQPASQTGSSVVWCTTTFRHKEIETSEHGSAGQGSAFSNATETASWKGWTVPENEDEDAISQKESSTRTRVAGRLSHCPLPMKASGLARSVICVSATLPVSVEVIDSAASLSQKLTDEVPAEELEGVKQVGNVTYSEQLLDTNLPRLWPSNPIWCGMHIFESIRFGHAQAASHQRLVVLPLGPPLSKQYTLINPDDKPSALLNVHDLRFDAHPCQDSSLGAVRKVHTDCLEDGIKSVYPMGVVEIPCSVSLTIIGDCPMSVPTAAAVLAHKFAASKLEHLKFIDQFRAVLLFGGVQCHTVNEHGRTACSKEMNKSIENTSKIKLPDNHRCPSSTLFQAFIVGHCNVPVQFAGTAWEGAYGASYDCGSIASIGFGAKHTLSDERMPAAAAHISQKQVNDLTARLAPKTIRKVGKWHKSALFASTPSELWGIARGLTPGVHDAAKELAMAFKTLRSESNTSTHDSVMSIQSLPFSPFTEAVSPVVRHDQWTGLRLHPRRGHTFQADETLIDSSIMNSPLLNACRVNMLQVGSCLGENIYTNVQVVEIACTLIGIIAKHIALLSDPASSSLDVDKFQSKLEELSYGDAMETLRSCIDFIHSDFDNRLERWKFMLVLDALILFNVCAPVNFEVGENCVLDLYAAAPSACQGGAENLRAVAELHDLPQEAVQRAKAYWNRFGDDSESGCWRETKALVATICTAACSFDSDLATLQKASVVFEQWIRSLWKLHSDDGLTRPGPWSPLSRCPSPKAMCAGDDRPAAPNENRKHQRGALFGLANSALNQILTLLAASHCQDDDDEPPILVQHARNEGNMCIRHSCCALKRGPGNSEPSAKSMSPVHSENDWEAFGDKTAKEEQAHRQLKAWEINNELLFRMTSKLKYTHGITGQTRGSSTSYKTNTDHTQQRLETGAIPWAETSSAMKDLSAHAKKMWTQFTCSNPKSPLL
jgi:hypothetical protein